MCCGTALKCLGFAEISCSPVQAGFGDEPISLPATTPIDCEPSAKSTTRSTTRTASTWSSFSTAFRWQRSNSRPTSRKLSAMRSINIASIEIQNRKAKPPNLCYHFRTVRWFTSREQSRSSHDDTIERHEHVFLPFNRGDNGGAGNPINQAADTERLIFGTKYGSVRAGSNIGTLFDREEGRQEANGCLPLSTLPPARCDAQITSGGLSGWSGT